jgi:hypothetical protein
VVTLTFQSASVWVFSLYYSLLFLQHFPRLALSQFQLSFVTGSA